MRDSPPASALGRGAVNLDGHGYAQDQNTKTTTANPAVKGDGKGISGPGDELDTQQVDALKLQFLEDSQADEGQLDEGYANLQGNRSQDTKRDIGYSQLAATAGPLVSETQLQGLFDDTQFDKGYKKLALQGAAGREERKGKGDQRQSQDTQWFEESRGKLLDGETQGESEVEVEAPKEIVKQAWSFVGVDKEGEPERESVEELEKGKGRIPTQEGETQFEAFKAQLLDSAEDSQIDNTVQEKTVLTDNSAQTREAEGPESQGSDQVVLFPPGTSFGAGQADGYSQSQSQSHNDESGPVSNQVVTTESQDRESQVPASHTHVHVHGRQPGSDYLNPPSSKPSPTSHLPNQLHATITNASARIKTPKEFASTPSSKQTKRKRSEADIKKLHGRAMDDWQRDSLGTASQTQENSGPRYGPAQNSQEDGSSTKKNRSSAAQSGIDVDRTYNENESGAVRLGLTQSQSESQNLGGDLAVSQDQGMRSPSYDLAKLREVDDTSQIEPETPATAKKNPFGTTGKAVPMAMSQVFAATQSSPLDPRFLPPSDGLRPSSPGIGLPSSPIARRGSPLKKRMSPEVEESSPTHVTLTVASSFQPFDESTQPEAIRKANAKKTRSLSPFRQEIPEYIRLEVAEKFKGRTEPGEIRESQEECKRIRKQGEEARKAEEARRRYLEDDGMDIERDNWIRETKRKQELAAEKNLREVSDMMGPRTLSDGRPAPRQRAISEKVITKRPIREQRLARKSAERASPPKDKKVEEVEVPASGEAAKAQGKTPQKKSSRRSRSQSEEYRAQSEGLDARDAQGTESQVIRSSQAQRSSQQEVVVDSQNNASTQAMTDHNSVSLEEDQDSYHPPPSTTRKKSKLNRTSSVPPALGGEDITAGHGSSPPAVSVSVPVSSSGHYLKNPNTPPRGSRSRSTKSSNETAPDIVPETSPAFKTATPASKTASPNKLPFEDLDMVDDTPMQSFSDIRMTQEAPGTGDVTPTKFRVKTFGKKSPVKKRPEQEMGRGARVVFEEVLSDDEGEEVVVKKGKKGLGRGDESQHEKSKIAGKSARFVVDEDDNGEPRGSPSPAATKAAKGKPAPKSAKFVVDEDEDEGPRGSPSPPVKKVSKGKGKQAAEPRKITLARMSATPVEDKEGADAEASPSPPPKRSSRSKGKQAEQAKSVPTAKVFERPSEDEDDVANADAIAILQKLGRGRRAKKSVPDKRPPKIVAPAEDSPQSSPILPAAARRSTRRQPPDLKNQAAPATAPATSEDHDMQESSDEDDAPIARAPLSQKYLLGTTIPNTSDTDDDDAPIARAPLSQKQLLNITIPNTSDTEMADASPAKKTNQLTGTPPFLPPMEDDEDSDEDESVSPIRPSIETGQKLTVCARFAMDLSCDKDHSIDGLFHDETRKARFMRLQGKTSEIPSTASPGKSASPEESGRQERSVSAFTRPEPTGEAHLPPTATGGRTHREPVRQQPEPEPQPQSAHATAQSTLPSRVFSVESSPLSELASDVADELEEFHTAHANIAEARPSRRESRSASEMSDALLMPPPQTVSRQLDFVAPPPPAETPALPQTGKVKGTGNKRSASTSEVQSKKAAKTATDDTPSRSRRATRSVSLAAASAEEDDGNGDDTLVVGNTSKLAPTRRVGRQASRPSYAESPSTDGGDTAVAAAGPVIRASRTPSPFTAVASGLQPGEVNHGLFKGMAFAVSYKDGSREGVRDREEIEQLILDHGGQLIEDFKDLFEKIDIGMVATPNVSRANSSANLASASASANTSMAGPSRRSSLPPQAQAQQLDDESESGELVLTKKAKKLGFVALIGDAPTRKSKFLQALALELPCLNSQWIRYCIAHNAIMAWRIFMLSSGVSRKLQGMECSRDLPNYSAMTARFEDTFNDRHRMLEGMGVLSLCVKKGRGKAEKEVLDARKEHYLWLMRALGARDIRGVRDVEEANGLLWDGGTGDGNGWDVVYVDDGGKLSSYRKEILGTRCFGEDAGDEAGVGRGGEDEDEDEDDELPEVPAKGKGKGKGKKPAAKAKAKSKGKKAAAAEDVEMPDADEEEDDTQPAEPKLEKRIRVVSDEFVVQSLILGGLEDEDLVDVEVED